MDEPRVTRWNEDAPPTRARLQALCAAEGITPYAWSNAPGDVYAAHVHGYHKVLYVVEGTITLGLPDLGHEITLYPGDRLDLPAGVLHDAQVGPQGVTCLEGQRQQGGGG